MEDKETKVHSPNWGGARVGSGRKPKKVETRGRKKGDGRGQLGGGRKPSSEEGARGQMTFYLLPSSCNTIRTLRAMGLNKVLTKAVDTAIAELADTLNL